MTSVICCTLVVAIAVPAALQAQPTTSNDAPWPPPTALGCHDLPQAVRIEPPLRPIVMEMCRRAPVFRRQLARLGAQPGLTVTVGIWRESTSRSGRVRAVTQLRRMHGDLQAADVQVRIDQPDQVVEHLAHEFEHIMEQLDGIDLSLWVGRSGVYRVVGSDSTSAIETARARYVGRMVAAEYAANAAAMPAAEHRP